MMTILFCGMILSGILLGGLTGRMPQVSQAAIEQSGEAVRLTLSPVSYTHLEVYKRQPYIRCMALKISSCMTCATRP